jgi:hypothetical protein
MLISQRIGLFLGVPVLLVLGGCGYSLRTSRDPSRIKSLGVQKVYVRPVKNETYRPGVENAVYSQLVRMLSSTPGLRAVNRPEDADGELRATVHQARRSVSGEIKASELNPKGVGSSTLLVASEFSALLECSFELSKPGRSLWSGQFTRARPFPANSQIGSLGSTGALINESEFDRALGEVASDMMADVRNSLIQDF